MEPFLKKFSHMLALFITCLIFSNFFPSNAFTQDLPSLDTASSPSVLDDGATSAIIQAAGVSNAASVLAVIMPPGYTGTVPADPDVADFPKLELTDKGDGKYQGTTSENVFSKFGMYEVAVYAKNAEGVTSDPKIFNIQQFVYKDVYEDDDTFEQASVINVGSFAQRHNFYEEGDADWVKFYGFADLPYIFDVKNVGIKGSVIIELYEDPEGVSVHSDMGLEGENVSIGHSFTQDGVYYVKFINCTSPSCDELSLAEYGENTGYDFSISIENGAIGDKVNCTFTVTDKYSSMLIEKANISAEHSTETVNKYATMFNEDSEKYSMELIVESEPYTLTCSAPGYETQKYSDFVVSDVTPDKTIEMELEAGALTVLTPEFSPPPGTYPSAQSVSITSTPSAVIYYTIDGTEPNANSKIYGDSPIDIPEGSTLTIKATAFKEGWNSANNAGSYTIETSNITTTTSSTTTSLAPTTTAEPTTTTSSTTTSLAPTTTAEPTTTTSSTTTSLAPTTTAEPTTTTSSTTTSFAPSTTSTTTSTSTTSSTTSTTTTSTTTTTIDINDIDNDNDGYTENQGDCDDANHLISPGVEEICNDGIDNNCDGKKNECCVMYYKDTDKDGYSDGQSLTSCTKPKGYRPKSKLTATSGDCNDEDFSVNPGAEEICNNKDDNCDDKTDECCVVYYKDADGDGYSDGTASEPRCDKPEGYKSEEELTATSGDCDDDDSSVNPGAEEICNHKDDNCDDKTDECCVVYYKDADGDGYSDGTDSGPRCDRPEGYKSEEELTATSGDCDDDDSSVNPGAEEICNHKDDNCDDKTDECCVVYYKDADGDGYSDGTGSEPRCDRPEGYKSEEELTATSGDCDDDDSSVNPGAEEICNHKDDNCDDKTDECCVVYYKDADGDGYSDGTGSEPTCDKPEGYKSEDELAALFGDCNDEEFYINPGITREVCNGVDDNCDEQIDEYVCDNPDEHEADRADNDHKNAASIKLNTEQYHTFHSENDEDWVKFYGFMDAVYTIKLKTQGQCEPLIELYDSDGETPIYRDKKRKDENKDIFEWVCSKTGEYYLKMENASSYPLGENTEYSLVIKAESLELSFLQRIILDLQILTGASGEGWCNEWEVLDADGDGRITLNDVSLYARNILEMSE
ncbi:MopE-related protein [Desulfonema magnum]|uniref:Metal-binding motif-containing protein n=1 Tax=Desulfonema magnum TaxID=45655 RepID=A0A975BMC5_9BACT|nr:MopE-related protein [Desulfonema magnum]QTA88133.1 Putative metal-binding motif-containing protein [Desulfonema magnum]